MTSQKHDAGSCRRFVRSLISVPRTPARSVSMICIGVAAATLRTKVSTPSVER
jgi:hypothetical protein